MMPPTGDAPSSPQQSLPAAAPPSADGLATATEAARRLGPATVLAALSAIGPLLGTLVLWWYAEPIKAWLHAQGDAAIPLFVLGFTLTAGLALLPTYAQAGLAGWAFGFRDGFMATMSGVFGAALLGYIVARLASGERATRLIREHPRWQVVYQALLGGGMLKTLGIVTLLRLPPNSPFALCNLLLAATRVPWHTYLLGTVFGLGPRTALVCYTAARLSDPDVKDDRLFWWAGIGITVVVLVVIGSIANRALGRFTGGAPPVPPPAR